MEKKRICIVTPDYLSCTPRVVKEADALYEAGFAVTVVFSQGNLKEPRYFDEILLKDKPWQWYTFGWAPFIKGEKLLYYKSKLRYHIAKRLPSAFWKFGKLAEYAEGRVYKELASLAKSCKADIYIGHYPIGLAAAAYASFCNKAKLGYDIEDLYGAEQPLTKKGIRETQRIKIIESRYLPYCRHISCVSELVAEEIAKRYNINRKILVIHNVFPLRERNNLDGKVKDRRGNALSLYWFSQVIGENRGIEDIIRAAGLLKEKIQIHLRGVVSQEYKRKLIILARSFGIEDFLYFHPSVPPSELLSRTAEHDVGLALEQPVSLSRCLSITNKLFFYMLAGLCIVVTDLPGQKYIYSNSPDIGFLYPPGDYQTLAKYLYKLISTQDLLNKYKQASLRAAQEKWNWEKESQNLIENIKNIINH